MRLHLDPDDSDVDAYRLLTSIVVPRPIAWISTLSSDGVGNLAPHSFFGVASAKPPMVTFTSVGAKDTVRNVRETGEFVISTSTEAMMEAVNSTSAPWGPEVDEAAALDVAMEPSVTVAPLRVAGAPASMECTVHQIIEIGDSVLVIGRVLQFTVDDAVMVDGEPSYDLMRPVTRLGGELWGLPSPTVQMSRPT
ncbi:flavin reductase family protein [Aeromicrobium sp. CF3.5]|uniref:flavin reductase family protein n=1 Tax=Aeromicrobium sp. CF3.5 TaxID=3373078 RepID=UPI003EE482FC